jgi:hypothetical protein
MGGEGLVAHNLFFNLNRETKDTAALNSWGRRTYLFSEQSDPLKPQLVPSATNMNRWRNNLVLGRNYWGVRDGNGDCLRCDDGASWFNMSSNVCYTPKAASQHSGMEFNGGSQVRHAAPPWLYICCSTYGVLCQLMSPCGVDCGRVTTDL